MSTQNKKEIPHKLTAECFNKCAKWKLNVTLTVNKTSTGLILHGNGLFFKMAQNSVLNNFQIIDNISEITQSTLKNLKENAFSKENNNSEFFTSFNFPINNSENYNMISDFNCINNRDINNVIFLEIDINSKLNNISYNHLKALCEINNDFVEKEIYLGLNGTIHGQNVFKKELRMSVEARRFIKSMQYRLENYKNEFIDKQKSIQKSNPNFEIKNAKCNFFTKVIPNGNFGIEFCKPNFDNVETYPTNFNSIVNSGININKFYFEICIPQNLIDGRSSFDLNDSYHNKSRVDNSFKYKNEYNTANYYGNNYSRSPNYNKNYSGEILGELERLNLNYDKNNHHHLANKNSQKITSNDYYSPYYKLERKKSNHVETSIYDTKDNSKFNYNNTYQIYTPNGTNYNRNLFDSSMSKNASKYQNKKYSYNYDNNYNSNNNNFTFTKNEIINPNLIKQFNSKNFTSQILLTHNEGMCNFLIFVKSCSPYVYNADTHLIDDIKILNFFKNFEKISAFGLDINLILDNEISNVNYTPTLSSMEIFFSDSITYENIINELNNFRQKEEFKFYDYNETYLKGQKILFEYNMNENLKFVCYENTIKIEFYETKPPHSRCILINQLEYIFSCLNCFESIDLKKIDSCSWFCVLWSPFKSSKMQFASTSFLVYYQFSYTENEIYMRGYNNYLEIPIIGILPVKMEDVTWLSLISKVNNLGTNYKYTSSLIDFKIALNDSVNNVHDFVFSNTDRTSTDYDFYLKCSM